MTLSNPSCLAPRFCAAGRVTKLFCAATLSLAAVGNAYAVDVGTAAPELELLTASGQKLDVITRGKLVYVDFWASWCGPCKQSFPWMNEMQTKYAARGLQVVAINLDQKSADAQKFLSAVPAKFLVGFDPKGITPKAYGVKIMPTTFLIDRNGKLLMQHNGFAQDDSGVLERQIQQALESKP